MTETTQKTCTACTMLARGVKFRTTPPHTCDKKASTEKHQWVQDESYTDNSFKERHICKVCGCERLMFYLAPKIKGYIYSREKIVFGSERPGCIDWNDRDALNRID